MATGIPIVNGIAEKNGKFHGNGINYHLEYRDKAPVEEILKSSPAKLKRIINMNGLNKGKIIYGDNLSVLRTLMDDNDVVGKIRLIYIDPPYSTGYNFESRKQKLAYTDHLSGAMYLEFLRKRLILMYHLLADNGSIYVHLDENMAFPAKVLLDEIFGYKNFRNLIVRKKSNPKNFTRKTYGNIADYILFYTKTDDYIWNQPFEKWNDESSKREYPCVEDGTGRRYKKVPVHAPGIRNGFTGQEWRGKNPPPGKHWQYIPSELDKMDERGEIYWSPTGNPRRKIYFENSKGISVQDIWLNFKDAHNQNIHITGYPTEKNPNLLARIIQASSNRGDLVLDAFAGSGTLAAVSEEYDRRWIVIDNSLLAIKTIIQRMTKGTSPMGDFVKQKTEKSTQSSLSNAILCRGFDVFIEESLDLEPISKSQLEEWSKLMS